MTEKSNAEVVKQLFAGQMMVCVLCRSRQKSDPRVSSQWRAIDVESCIYYVCPDEFPADDAGADAFQEAYTKVLGEIARLRAEGKTCNRLSGGAACLNPAQWQVKIIFRAPPELAHCHFHPVEAIVGLQVCSHCRQSVKVRDVLIAEGWEQIRQALSGLKLDFSLSRKGARVGFIPLFSIHNN